LGLLHSLSLNFSSIELINASIRNLFNEEVWLSESCPNLLGENLLKSEKLLAFSGQKR
jgi:hypothetical protein